MKTWEALKLAGENEGKVVVSCEDVYRCRDGEWQMKRRGEWVEAFGLSPQELNGQWTVEEEPVELPKEIPDNRHIFMEEIRILLNQLIRFIKAEKEKQ